ncbi:MAG: phosphate ABC transporter permease subunit PstC [Nitrososphaerota archaeon]|nr:phosphate ABC transporter permease subunit PstC [Nitrososphaerota archaeon]
MTAPAKERRRSRSKGDVLLKTVVGVAAAGIVVLLVGLGLELTSSSWLSITTFGLGFITGSTWNSAFNTYSVFPALLGTLVASGIALLLGLPVGLGVAIFLSERTRGIRKGATALGSLIELLAAVPSVIYGLWGFLVLVPFMKVYIEPTLKSVFGFLPFLFSGTPIGTDLLTGGVILAIMIVPTVSAVSRDVLNAVPNSQREAMYSLGATDWEVVRKAVLPYARSGIFGATILGLGRAVGETMAVTFVIGNSINLPKSLLSPGATLTTVIVNQFGNAFDPLSQAALVEVGLVLFLLALVINTFARLLVWRMTKSTRFRV